MFCSGHEDGLPKVCFGTPSGVGFKKAMRRVVLVSYLSIAFFAATVRATAEDEYIDLVKAEQQEREFARFFLLNLTLPGYGLIANGETDGEAVQGIIRGLIEKAKTL